MFRQNRLAVALACWLPIFLGLAFLPVNWFLKAGGFLLVVTVSLPLFATLVLAVTGVVFLNLLTGKLTAFGSGLQFKFPWETVERHFPLELVTKRHEETYPAKDGPLMVTKWSYQYRPSLGRLDTFIAIDETTISQGLADVIRGILSQIIGGEEAETARKDIKRIEREAVRQFREKELEERYGINFEILAIADIDFSADYQEARSAKARMEKFASTAGLLKERMPDLSDKEAVNVTLLEQGKSTKKQIIEVEGLGDALTSAAKILKGDKQ